MSSVEKISVNRKIFDYIEGRFLNGHNSAILQGGRRSGKTFGICQYFIRDVFNEGYVCNIASMTSEQGRLGAYADCKTIIGNSQGLTPAFDIFTSPREIRCKHNSGKIFFNSYQNSETAKGIACDYLLINEANNFSKQQYVDLVANVRRGIFMDYNPNVHFWVDDFFSDDDILKTTWQDNKSHLTPLQLEYFETLKRNAFREGATAMDEWLYRVYYLGEYAELAGSIFTPVNIKTCKPDEVPSDLIMPIVFSDPSARCGGDYHANVFCAFHRPTNKVYVLDVYSTNIDTDYEVAMLLLEWSRRMDRVVVYVETNGAIGQGFYDYCRRSQVPCKGFNSHSNKIERILANYNGICDDVIFVDNPRLKEFLSQVYSFDGYTKKCEHDDNVDAVNSAYTIYKPYIRK